MCGAGRACAHVRGYVAHLHTRTGRTGMHRAPCRVASRERTYSTRAGVPRAPVACINSRGRRGGGVRDFGSIAVTSVDQTSEKLKEKKGERESEMKKRGKTSDRDARGVRWFR